MNVNVFPFGFSNSKCELFIRNWVAATPIHNSQALRIAMHTSQQTILNRIISTILNGLFVAIKFRTSFALGYVKTQHRFGAPSHFFIWCPFFFLRLLQRLLRTFRKVRTIKCIQFISHNNNTTSFIYVCVSSENNVRKLYFIWMEIVARKRLQNEKSIRNSEYRNIFLIFMLGKQLKTFSPFFLFYSKLNLF